MFVTSYHLPKMIDVFVSDASAAFTPVSMIVIGSNLADFDFHALKMPKALTISLFFRNLLFPVLGIMILKLAGITGIPLYTTVILNACPVAGLVVLFTLQAKGDAKPATVLMGLSTILCLVTIPLAFLLAKVI